MSGGPDEIVMRGLDPECRIESIQGGGFVVYDGRHQLIGAGRNRAAAWTDAVAWVLQVQDAAIKRDASIRRWVWG